MRNAARAFKIPPSKINLRVGYSIPEGTARVGRALVKEKSKKYRKKGKPRLYRLTVEKESERKKDCRRKRIRRRERKIEREGEPVA